MSDINAEVGIAHITWEAKVIRADGTEEDLGVIAEYHADEDGVPLSGGFLSRPRVKAIIEKVNNVR